MLRAALLGHQGWLLSSSSTRVLVDPLLTAGFGHGGLAGAVFPGRVIDLGRLSPIDAVFLTHEHDDHFDIASILRLDRRIPILISARSSFALSEFLRAHGFEVRRLEPNSVTRVGDLDLQVFVADHRTTPDADEWDVLPFIVSDATRQGVFASSVDVPMPSTMLEVLVEMPGWPGVVCIANNTTDTRFVTRGAGVLSRSDDTEALARVLVCRFDAWARRLELPRFIAITGGGWRHPPELEWVDTLAFSVEPGRLASSLSKALGTRVHAMLPGEGIALEGSRTTDISESAVSLQGPSEREGQARVEVPPLPSPALRRTAADDDETRLAAGLERFARFLYGREVFTQVHSLASTDALAFVLHRASSPIVFAYRPWAGDFERVTTPDAFVRYACGFECWAVDLLALFEGRLAASALCYTGRLRCWNHLPAQLRVSPQLLWLFSHPLHQPKTARALYDHVAEHCGPVAIEVQAR
ncbi:MAG: MBL fold metallo-hydrolase [Nannocystales bacterium]